MNRDLGLKLAAGVVFGLACVVWPTAIRVAFGKLECCNTPAIRVERAPESRVVLAAPEPVVFSPDSQAARVARLHAMLDVQDPEPAQRSEWVAKTLKEMQTVHTGMTRADLLRVFEEEGGLSTVGRRTYVSRRCPYFKVDVEFKAAGDDESPKDRIVKISRPYLDWSISD